MSANAGTWFYQEPEHNLYMLTERLNGNFWQARIVEVYWRCVRAEPPFCAQGYWGDYRLELEWLPGSWVAFKAPAGGDALPLVEAISKRILAMRVSLTYTDAQDRQVFEWNTDGGGKRWQEIQGNAGFNKPRRLM
jgi:hypothetical protein